MQYVSPQSKSADKREWKWSLFNDHFHSLLSLTIFIYFDLIIHVYLFIVEINCTDIQTVDVWNTILFLWDA